MSDENTPASSEINDADIFAILTPRQREVAERAARSMINAAIAGDLGISEKTVKAHMTNLMHLFDAKNRTNLALRITALTASREEAKLVEFFRSPEGDKLGRDGDYDRLTPAETAIRAMRRLLKLEAEGKTP